MSGDGNRAGTRYKAKDERQSKIIFNNDLVQRETIWIKYFDCCRVVLFK